MKGLVWLDGADERYVVQSVGQRLEIEPGNAWPEGQERKRVMVFIGKKPARKNCLIA